MLADDVRFSKSLLNGIGSSLKFCIKVGDITFRIWKAHKSKQQMWMALVIMTDNNQIVKFTNFIRRDVNTHVTQVGRIFCNMPNNCSENLLDFEVIPMRACD